MAASQVCEVNGVYLHSVPYVLYGNKFWRRKWGFFRLYLLLWHLLREESSVFENEVHVRMSGPIDECNIRMNTIRKWRFSESNAVVTVALIWHLMRERKVDTQAFFLCTACSITESNTTCLERSSYMFYITYVSIRCIGLYQVLYVL